MKFNNNDNRRRSKGSYLNMFFSLFMKNYKHVYDVI